MRELIVKIGLPRQGLGGHRRQAVRNLFADPDAFVQALLAGGDVLDRFEGNVPHPGGAAMIWERRWPDPDFVTLDSWINGERLLALQFIEYAKSL